MSDIMGLEFTDSQKKQIDDSIHNSSAINPKVITDEPDKDPSDFRRYANELSKLITNSDARFTVGIYGGWGTGKSTLMQMIKNRLEMAEFKDDIITIWLDAWRYENEKYMTTIPLIRTIKIEVDNRINQALSNNRSVSRGLKKLRDGVNKTFHALARSAKLNASLNLGAGAGMDLDVAEFTDIFHSEGSVTIDNEEVHYRKQHITDYLADTVKAFTEENKERRRIVIFVDDLDRCTPEKALELLESIKTFFDIEGIIYVLGMDPRTIDPIIKTKYGEKSTIEGLDYLQKIVQLPFQIPVWSAADISKTIRNMISKTGMAQSDIKKIIEDTNIEIIIRAAQLNPRDVKRFINTVILSKVIYGHSSKDFEKLIAIQAFYFRGNKWIDFLKLIIPYKIRLEFLKNFIILVSVEYGNASNLEDLSKSINDIENYNRIITLDKLTEEIFKKLDKLNDNDLFLFLKTSAVSLIKIDNIDKYLRAVDTFDLKDRSQTSSDLDLDTDTEKQLELLRNGKVTEFNLMRKQKTTSIHLPLEDLTSKDDLGNVKGLKLRKVNLDGAFLFKANLEKANLRGASLVSADLSYANLFGADLSDANLAKANLAYANMLSASLSGANFSSANMHRAFLENAVINRAYLNLTILSSADLSYADLSSADLSSANLRAAFLKHGFLPSVNLTYANLQGANLSYTHLYNADLSHADLSQAFLIGIQNFTELKTTKTNFHSAIITSAKFIDYLQDERNGAQNVPELVKNKQELATKLEEHRFTKEEIENILSEVEFTGIK